MSFAFFFFFFFKQKTAYEIMPSLVGSEMCIRDSFIGEYPHGPGGHCSSTALRDLLKFYGHDFTEDMVFGLGAGIGFIYFSHPDTVSYTHLRAHETRHDLVCRLLL